ncbi:hypothetical protein E2C01_018306 [Portunus trituberculatus]|uniref:Uncharacterized protein n=1 Tax=Portunus trituberculatus TaxID=210409 RepID=A0A5B7DU62_PORTR|nr:hypothetical protein [Portunus trituberculatus]
MEQQQQRQQQQQQQQQPQASPPFTPTGTFVLRWVGMKCLKSDLSTVAAGSCRYTGECPSNSEDKWRLLARLLRLSRRGWPALCLITLGPTVGMSQLSSVTHLWLLCTQDPPTFSPRPPLVASPVTTRRGSPSTQSIRTSGTCLLCSSPVSP